MAILSMILPYLDYWSPVLRVREHFQKYYQERQIVISAYEERILCYQCYVTLDAMRFYAKSGQEKSYAVGTHGKFFRSYNNSSDNRRRQPIWIANMFRGCLD